MTKFLTAVSALALGLAMSSAALADDAEANGPGNDAAVQVNDNGDNRGNNNQDNDQDNDQANGNAVASGNTVASHNDTDISDIGNTDVSVDDNELALNSNNDNSQGNNRNNDQSVSGNSLLSDNTTEIASRNNIAVDNSVDINVEDNAIGIQSLSATVTGVGNDSVALGLLALANNDVDTGDNDTGNNAFRGLTGIATVSQESGQGSIGQAATQVNANASLNFN